uniref:Tctex1 domain-containing protein 1 n=1 Tax=Gongylonema pulchrum TaxID=637853 RepID=A0A183EKT3_9BILA
LNNSCCFVAKARNDAKSDIPGRKSTGATAAACRLPEAFCSAKTSHSFSIANYDDVSNCTPEQLAKLIDQAVDMCALRIVSSYVQEAYRRMIFTKKGTEVVRKRLSQGEQFCYVFRWLDDLLCYEEMACSSTEVCFQFLLACFF